MSKQQNISYAIVRLERAAMAVVAKAEQLATSETPDARSWARQYLLSASREYVAALNYLKRMS